MELKAIETGIYKYCQDKISLHVRFTCDNVTAIAYINNKGSIKSETGNNIACRIWNFCNENKLWVSAAHKPGKNNFHILRRFSKLVMRQSLTDVNMHWHLTSLCNLMYTIYIPYATHVILIYLFFNKHFPWIRAPIRYLFTFFWFLKFFSEL